MPNTTHNDPVMFNEAYKHLARTVEQRIGLPIGKNAVYTQHDIMAAACFTSMEGISFTRAHAKLVANGLPVPNDDTILYHLGKMDAQSMNHAFSTLMTDVIGRAQSASPFPETVVMAMDYTYLPYAGDRNTPGVVGTKRVRGTNWAFGFLTTEIVMEGLRFCTALHQVVPLESRKVAMEETLLASRNRIGKSRKMILLADREFFTDDCMLVFSMMADNYIVPVKQNKAIARAIKGYRDYRWMVYPYRFVNGAAGFHIVTVEEPAGSGHFFVFATGRPPASYEEAVAMAELYRKRWGIETGYRTKKYDFLARTCSRTPVVRRFLFLLAIALYNIWTLINYLTAHDERYSGLKRYRRAWEFKMALTCTFYFGRRRLEVLVRLGIG